jgi:uncharacterized tellurite resistance protein B-like protein
MLREPMLDRLRDLFMAGDRRPGLAGGGEKTLAAAALLMEVAAIDGSVSPEERQAVSDVLARHFALPAETVARLVAEGEEAQAGANQLLRFTRAIKDRFDEAERVALMELLWEVVLADGVIDHLEANLMRRLAGLIYVTDQDSGRARQRVVERRRADGTAPLAQQAEDRSDSRPWGSSRSAR